MAETHRYKVGKAQGYAQDSIMKLTAKQAAEKGLTDADRADVSTTADDSRKANRYEEAMTSQDEMRASEAAAIAESSAGDDDQADAEASSEAGETPNKKRGTRA